MKTNIIFKNLLKSVIYILVFNTGMIFAQSFDLNGYWQSDEGACYQLRQSGNEVVWVKEDVGSKRAVNIFVGSIAGNILSGLWYDLPENPYKGFASSISLKVENNNRIVKMAESAQYLGNTWARVNPSCVGNAVLPDKFSWNSVHEHAGCAVKNFYCGRYTKDPIIFKSLNQGYIEATYKITELAAELVLKGTLTGQVYDFKYYLGGAQTGTGRFVFSTDMRSFEGTWDDPTGHKGTWTGRAPY